MISNPLWQPDIREGPEGKRSKWNLAEFLAEVVVWLVALIWVGYPKEAHQFGRVSIKDRSCGVLDLVLHGCHRNSFAIFKRACQSEIRGPTALVQKKSIIQIGEG